MKNKNTIWAIIAIIAICAAAGIGVFAIWQNNKNKPGSLDQAQLMALIASPFNWFNEDYADNLVAGGRESRTNNTESASLFGL